MKKKDEEEEEKKRRRRKRRKRRGRRKRSRERRRRRRFANPHISPNISCVYIDRRISENISYKLMCENSILTSYYLRYLHYQEPV